MSAKSPQPDDGKRPARKGFLLRVSPDLMDELRGWANQDLRSLNAHIEFLLRQALKRRKGSRDPDTDDPEGSSDHG